MSACDANCGVSTDKLRATYRLIELPQVDLALRQAEALEQRRHRERWPDALHVSRIEPEPSAP